VTCIVGIVEEDKVFMGGDSCASDEWSWSEAKNPKVFINGPFLIGGCGSFRMIDLLHYTLEVENQHQDLSDDRFMRTVFIESARLCLREGGILESEGTGGDFLVGYNNNLYYVQSDFAVLDCPEWGMSVGSGSYAARGSLASAQHLRNHGYDFDAEQRIVMALESAEMTTQTVRNPWVLLNI